MKKITVLLILMTLRSLESKAQIYVEPVTGYQLDVNNKGRFRQVNTSVQVSFKKSKNYELIVLAQKTWPVKVQSIDSAYTSNPAFPTHSGAAKTIRPSSFTIALGHRIPLTGLRTKNIFFILLYTGLNVQKFVVSYLYDNNNYTILNPDKTLTSTGLFLSSGVEYMRVLKTGRLFTQLSIAATPIRSKTNYPSSFRMMCPLSFNAGYSILIQKSKNGK